MTVSLDDLPTAARHAWTRLRDEAARILGNTLIGLWGFGGTVFPDRSRRLGDLDTLGAVERVPDVRTTQALERAQEEIARDFGIDWDTWYVLSIDAARSDPPPDALDRDRRMTSWAIDRAHWLAGWYVALSGRQPEVIVPAPGWPEIESALSRELEHLERHVVEGDDDPFEATYAISNGSRILHATRQATSRSPSAPPACGLSITWRRDGTRRSERPIGPTTARKPRKKPRSSA